MRTRAENPKTAMTNCKIKTPITGTATINNTPWIRAMTIS